MSVYLSLSNIYFHFFVWCSGWTSPDSQLSDEKWLHASVISAGWPTYLIHSDLSFWKDASLYYYFPESVRFNSIFLCLSLRALRRDRACAAAIFLENQDSLEVPPLPWPARWVLIPFQWALVDFNGITLTLNILPSALLDLPSALTTTD